MIPFRKKKKRFYSGWGNKKTEVWRQETEEWRGFVVSKLFFAQNSTF